MLLEAYQLLRNRIGQGHLENQSHEHFSTNISKRHGTWRLILNHDGSIYKIEPMSEEESPGFWSLVEGTSAMAKRFPALRIKSPLLKLGANAKEWDVLKRLSDNNLSDTRKRLLDLGSKLAAEKSINPQDFHDAWEFKAAPILNWNMDANDDLLPLLKQCVTAFGRFCGRDEKHGWEFEANARRNSREWKKEQEQSRRRHAEDITNNLVSAFLRLLQNATQKDQVKAVAAVLFGIRRVKQGQAIVEVATQLCIDLHSPEALGSTLYTSRMARMVLAYLGTGSSEELHGKCAISGKEGALLKSKLPDWDSPLFKTPPYSKFSAAPCNERYGKFGLDGFDVSSHLARSLVGALQGMTAQNLEGKTWAKLRNGKFKRQSGGKPIPQSDLFLAYPSFDIGDLVTVDVFVPRRDKKADEVTDRATHFVDCAERLCRTLKERTLAGSVETEYMRVMLVRAVSQGQIQLAYAASPTINDFVAAMENWGSSGKNLPPTLRLPLPYKKSDSDFRWRTPRLLFPEQICQLLSQQWTRDGSERTLIQGPPVGMVLDVFLRKQGVFKESAMRLLEMTLDRNEALLVGAGNVLHRGPHTSSEPWKLWKSFIGKAQSGKDKRFPDYALAQTISLIGSLLYAMNSTVNNFTNESAYLVGKLLAMMDELHKCYCVVVRDGDLPNSLIGNGLLRRAGDSPALAFSDLLDRSPIYLGWAKTATVTEKMSEQKKIAVHSARKVLRLAQPLVDQLRFAELLEVELSTIGKAHLFLGYLSPALGAVEAAETTSDDDNALSNANVSNGSPSQEKETK
jgi:hypothetical protein